jgi:hypothetical protein
MIEPTFDLDSQLPRHAGNDSRNIAESQTWHQFPDTNIASITFTTAIADDVPSSNSLIT